jgi:hypothetical protein
MTSRVRFAVVGVPGVMEQKPTTLCISLYVLCFYRHLSSGLSGCHTHHRW